MEEHAYISDTLSSLSSLYVELTPQVNVRDSELESTYKDKDHSGIVKKSEFNRLIPGEILAWSISRYGRLLSIYKFFLEPRQKLSAHLKSIDPEPEVNEQGENEVSSLEFRLPCAAIFEPLVLQQNNKNFIRVFVLCEGFVLVVLDLQITQTGLLNVDSKTLNVVELKRELILLEIDVNSLGQSLYVSAENFGTLYVSGSDGVILEIKISEMIITSIENTHLKLRKLTKKVQSWRELTGTQNRNNIDLSDIKRGTTRLLAIHPLKVEREQYMLCILDTAIILIDLKKMFVIHKSIISIKYLIDDKHENPHFNEVLLYEDGPPMVKFTQFPTRTMLCICIKAQGGGKGILIYNIDHDLLLLNSQRKCEVFEIELVSYAQCDENILSDKDCKIIDFDCSSPSGFKPSGTCTLFVLYSKTDYRILSLTELDLDNNIPNNKILWKTMKLLNPDASKYLNNFDSTDSDHILERIFNGDVDYSLLREALLNFMDQNSTKSLFIDMAFDIEKLKSISYYAIVNLARRLIFDLYNENYPHTLGNEKLHKTILDNAVQNFLENCRAQYLKNTVPLCIKYDESLNCALLLGVRSIGIIRNSNYYECTKNLKDEPHSEFRILSELINEIPLNFDTIKNLVTVLLYRNHSSNLKLIFKKLSKYLFRSTNSDNSASFVQKFSSIKNYNMFFSKLLSNNYSEVLNSDTISKDLSEATNLNVNKKESNVNTNDNFSAENSTNKFQLISAQFVLETYSQLSLFTYNQILNMILVLLYAFSISDLNFVIEQEILDDILIEFNCAAVHRILSSVEETFSNVDNKIKPGKTILNEKNMNQDDGNKTLDIKEDTDAHDYYDNLSVDLKIGYSIVKMEKPVIKRAGLMCLFNAYKCLDSELFGTRKFSDVILNAALKFVARTKPLFSINHETLCSTNHMVKLIVEMKKIGMHKTVKQVIGISGNNPLISYISARNATEEGLFNNAIKGYEHFASHIINVYSNDFAKATNDLQLLSGLLPSHIIANPDAYVCYMHVLNDCSTSKLNKTCPSFTAHFATMALLLSKENKEFNETNCVKRVLLFRIFNSFIDMDDIDACLNLMAEAVGSVDLSYFTQRILKHCASKNKLYKLLTKSYVKPLIQFFINEITNILKNTSIDKNINSSFEYACCLFSLYIKADEHQKACSFMYEFSYVVAKFIGSMEHDSSKLHEYLKILCMCYLPIIEVLQENSSKIPCFPTQSAKIDYGCNKKFKGLLEPENFKMNNKNSLPSLKFFSEIKTEYLRIFSVLSHAQNNGSKLYETAIFSNETALKLYVEKQDYEMAFIFGRKCGMDLSEIYISLTRLCLDYSSSGCSELPECIRVPANYTFIGGSDILQNKFMPQEKKIWFFLKKYLTDEQESAFYDYKYHYIVAEVIINSKKMQNIPYWLLTALKNNCIDKLILLYLNSNDLLKTSDILINELLDRKNNLMKEGCVFSTNTISPYLIDVILIQLRGAILKSITESKNSCIVIPDLLYHEYNFNTYSDFIKLIKSHSDYDKISQNDKILLEHASKLHSCVCQYVKAVNSSKKSMSALTL